MVSQVSTNTFTAGIWNWSGLDITGGTSRLTAQVSPDFWMMVHTSDGLNGREWVALLWYDYALLNLSCIIPGHRHWHAQLKQHVTVGPPAFCSKAL